jgi:hypothetical protein
MKTAIQELFSKLKIEHPNLFNTNTIEGRQFINDYYQFFEMEKQQIEDAFNAGCEDENLIGLEYYNKLYNNEK